jgi:hypothetical protein
VGVSSWRRRPPDGEEARVRADDLLDRRLVDHPLFYTWGADSQKLYYWLRRHVCRGEPGAAPEALTWHRQGFLTVYATAELLMARAAPVSKNTLTKLVGELRALGVVQTRSLGRGYLFLLGEWLRRPSQADGRALYFECFYLDALLMAEAGAAAPPAAAGRPPG